MSKFLRDLDCFLAQEVSKFRGLYIHDIKNIIRIEDTLKENLLKNFPKKSIESVRVCVGLQTWRYMFFIVINDKEYIRCIDGIDYRN